MAPSGLQLPAELTCRDTSYVETARLFTAGHDRHKVMKLSGRVSPQFSAGSDVMEMEWKNIKRDKKQVKGGHININK